MDLFKNQIYLDNYHLICKINKFNYMKKNVD